MIKLKDLKQYKVTWLYDGCRNEMSLSMTGPSLVSFVRRNVGEFVSLNIA